jgi:alkylhydroperoxidase family enzyme
VHQIARDWREAELSDADRALCEFGTKLMLLQSPMSRDDVEGLRSRGFDDAAIHDAAQVAGYFALMVRIAEGLGVEPESFIRRWGQEGSAGQPGS